ncbi:MAG: VOC family protein [Acidobacteria bacterium]|nr:VOC family protein [Acidobacteriota bacterium]
MKQAIEDLVDRYEAGKLTRRQMVQRLAVLALGVRPPQAGPSPTVAQAGSLNHVSLAVTDVARAQEFYERLLGIEVVSRQANGINLGLGTSFLGLYDIPGTPRPHHFCIGVEGFELEETAERLRESGLEPSFNRGVEVYFRDPDDILVQLSATDYRG